MCKFVHNWQNSRHQKTNTLSNGDTTARELSLCKSNATGREASSSNARPKMPNDGGGADRVPERLPNSSASPQSGPESRHGRSNTEPTSGPQSTPSWPLNVGEDRQEPKSNIDTIQPPSRAVDASAINLANGTLTQSSKSNQRRQESLGHYSKVENEEGELSPNGDIDGKNPIAYGDVGTKPGTKAKVSAETQQYRDGNGEDAGIENDADDEGSENASEAGNDVTGSESAGDECFHEEEEDVEHDAVEGKAENEGEAEVHCSGGEGSSLPLSERFLLSAKPLAKHMPTISQHTEKKDSRVFLRK